jgi:hypothetical protein
MLVLTGTDGVYPLHMIQTPSFLLLFHPTPSGYNTTAITQSYPTFLTPSPTSNIPTVNTLEKLHAKHVLPGFNDRSKEEREIERMTAEITRVSLHGVISWRWSGNWVKEVGARGIGSAEGASEMTEGWGRQRNDIIKESIWEKA